jgi:hypothetical protein
MPTSPQAIVEALTKLRAVHEARVRHAAEGVRLQNAAYVEALHGMDPKWFAAAVKFWLEDGGHFPRPKDLRETAAKLAGNAKAGEQARQLAIANGTDPGSALRNEAIMLLADYDTVLRRALGHDSAEYAYVLAECARWWQERRPPDERDPKGMPVSGYEVARRKRLLCALGRELEAFAAARLEPVPDWTAPPETAA